jgi:hypothetical protein
MKTITIPQLFEAVQLAIFNISANEEMQKKLNVFGATSKFVQTGHGLLQRAQMMYTTQEQNYNDSRRMSLQIAEDSGAVIEVFKDHIFIAKAAFRKESHILQELKINKVSSNLWTCIQQAMDFYQRAPQYMDTLQQYGATEASFQQNKASVEALLVLKAQRMKKKGDAEHSTQEKKQTVKDLRNWYGDFRKLARIALKDTPQMLETFGMVVSATRKKYKKTAQA